MLTIRAYRQSDRSAIETIYRDAFAGSPWFKTLSEDIVQAQWEKDSSRLGFMCLVGAWERGVVAALWWDTLSLSALQDERGGELVQLASSLAQSGDKIIWEREVMVAPAAQGRGIATQMRLEFLKCLKRQYPRALILTRMRDDNFGIVRVAQKLGFQRTGIRIPSNQQPGVMHEYWLKTLAREGVERGH